MGSLIWEDNKHTGILSSKENPKEKMNGRFSWKTGLFFICSVVKKPISFVLKAALKCSSVTSQCKQLNFPQIHDRAHSL